MFQHVLQDTRYRYGQDSSLLDLVITNGQEIEDHFELGDQLGAIDHTCICFTINCNLDTRFVLNLERSYISCKEYLKNIDWTCIEDFDVTDTSDFILKNICHFIEHFIPLNICKNI